MSNAIMGFSEKKNQHISNYTHEVCKGILKLITTIIIKAYKNGMFNAGDGCNTVLNGKFGRWIPQVFNLYPLAMVYMINHC